METEENIIIPEKWAIKRTEESNDVVIPWYLKNQLGSGYSKEYAKGYLHSHNYGFNGFSGSGHYCADDILHPDHTEITLEFFEKYILKEQKVKDNNCLITIL